MSESLEVYRARIARMHRELGIPPDYARDRGLELQPECDELVNAGSDVFGRQPQMDAAAWRAWQAMVNAAAAEEVCLQLVSAYRSAEYQLGIFRRKLDAGQRLDDILQVNAAPGYSEHHSGRALDLCCPDSEPLSEDFEHSAAFRWLGEHAGRFGFRLSFPRGNPHGVLYEPWHWRYAP